MLVQTSLVCEIRDGLPTIVASSACTCFQQILTEVNENIQEVLTEVDNIQEILTEVDENGDNIQEIFDLFFTPGCNSNGMKRNKIFIAIAISIVFSLIC